MTVKNRKELKCTSTDEWINKILFIVQWNIAGSYKDEEVLYSVARMSRENMLNDISLTENTKGYCLVLFLRKCPE